jgi:hypothetical protein
MEERGNKTIMCSVLFLDIVEYSKKSVAGQISLKDRFNSYLSAAIRDVPMTDRIILDTGDGAAINFLGDVEDALKAALSLRESLLAEDPNVDVPLLVRMGVNLGPVRLVRDINGQPNIVGDGINVAQRVMGFADAAQILVSRSYFDAVSRLSPQYAGMFHYQGSRTDKHVREHEVYAIGYPGDKTTHRGTIRPAMAGHAASTLAGAMQRAEVVWHAAASKLDGWIDLAIIRFRQADSKLRSFYVVIVAVPLLLLIMLLTSLVRHGEAPAMPTGMGESTVKTSQSGLAVVPAALVPVGSSIETQAAVPASSPAAPVLDSKKSVENNNVKETHRDKHKNKHLDKAEAKPKSNLDDQAKTINKEDAKNNAPVTTSSGKADAYISVTCAEGTEVFIDGIRKGRVGSSPLSIAVPPGKHTVIVSHTSRGLFTQSVEISLGRVVHIKPNLCN